MRDPVMPLDDAYTLLGLNGVAEPEILAAAFRKAIKAARPDFPGGDETRFRQAIAAYRLIQSVQPPRLALPAPKSPPQPRPMIGLTPLQAVRGAVVRIRLNRRTLQVRVPAGLRTGQHLRLRGADKGSDLHLRVIVRPQEGLLTLGDDLHMQWAVPRRVLDDGGRVEIQTHAGLRDAWITPGMQSPVRLRLRGLGLPACGTRPAGHLFVTLTPCADAPSAAEDLLARFSRVWTPERLAA